MTKIEMINMAIDLSYVHGRIVKFSGMEDCTGNLVNAIDNLVETIARGETTRPDGCKWCKYQDADFTQYPCSSCKHSYTSKWELQEGEDE